MARSVTVLNRRAAIVLAATLLIAAGVGALRAEPLASACTKTYLPQTLDNTQPLNLGQLKLQVYHYACSGAYDSELDRVLSEARTYLEKRASEVSKPALVLDIDETSLSNLPQELANDFGYIPNIPDPKCDALPKGPCGFNDWVLAGLAKAIPGTLVLFKTAKAHNVAVFFITGRHPNEADVTVKNLKSAGYEGWAGLVLRTKDDDKKTVAGYKSGERAKIAAQGYTIILNVGDQQSDLDGGYAERTYKLPNPFYYLP
jgi:acid phosphatase